MKKTWSFPFKLTVLILGVLILTGLVALALPGILSHAVPIAGGAFVFALMGVTSTSARFQETPCHVVVANNYDTCGTITRASVAHLTPAQLESLFRPDGLFGDMDAWFQTQFEMAACGTKINGMYDWVMSSQKDVGSLMHMEKIDRGPGLLYPFVKARQDSIINKDYWAITAGQANSAYTALVTGPLTAADKALGAAGDRVIRVVTRYGLDMNRQWFLDRDRVLLLGRAGNGASTRGVWKVLASEVAADLSYVDVLITSENSGSSTPIDSAPTSGLLIAMGNNVNDFESWCQNRPTLDPRHVVPYWVQTMRRTRCVSSTYKEVFARLMESNKYFQQFGDLPLAERNRQDEEEFQRRWLMSFFFGKPISANQTLALWQNLEQILTVTGTNTDPGTGGEVVAYRANMIGVYEQLRTCGQVSDLQNNTLNFYEWLDENYRIYRSRKSQGKMANSIDWFTDSVYAANMESAFVAYVRQEFGDIARIVIDEGSNALGFSWRSFKPKFPSGVTINLVTHEFFDDLVSAADYEGIKSSGRFLLALDIGKPGPRGGSIYPGMIASNRKQRTLGQLEELARLDPTFACTMANVTKDISLVSQTQTGIVSCPSDSGWLEGLNEAVPIVTGKTENPTYGNLY